MITVIGQSTVKDRKVLAFENLRGLSSDTKPTAVANGSTFYEMDTGSLYLFDEENEAWLEVGDDQS